MEDNLYYKKILISSGEVPETIDWYITDEGTLWWNKKRWEITSTGFYYTPKWFLKPVSFSPKEEAVKFAEWIRKNTFTDFDIEDRFVYIFDGNFYYSELELYTKYKDKTS